MSRGKITEAIFDKDDKRFVIRPYDKAYRYADTGYYCTMEYSCFGGEGKVNMTTTDLIGWAKWILHVLGDES